MTAMTFADCRAAARAVRDAEHGQQARATARPRSVLGAVRSRGPLSIMLFVADAEGRVVRCGSGSFALLEPPHARPGPRSDQLGIGMRLLRIVDRRWDILLFTLAPTLMLGAGGVLALVSITRGVRPPWTVTFLTLLALSYIAVFMADRVISAPLWIRRTLGFTPAAADEIAAESFPSFNWSMPLCHQAGPDDGHQLLQRASEQMEHLVKSTVARMSALHDVNLDGVQSREILVCLTRGVTTTTMRQIVADRLLLPYGSDSRVALRRPIGPVTAYPQPVKEGGGFVFLWIGGVAIIIAVLAAFVASIEQQACGSSSSCNGRPSTYATAMQWLTWRLLWQTAPGITTVTTQTQVFGWLLSVVGLMTIPVAGVSARLAIDHHKRMADEFKSYSTNLRNSRVLLMTVTDTERDAVLRAVSPLTGQQAEPPLTGQVAAYDLVAIGPTTLGLLQAPRQESSATHAAATEAIRAWKPDLVIMVGSCLGLREDGTHEPQRLADVIVAASIYDLDPSTDRDDGTEFTGPRPSAMPAAVSRLQAASTDWRRASVRFGVLLSAQTLVAFSDRSAALKNEFGRALGGEMEGHELYAAAADADVPWIIVKAISGWAFHRQTVQRPEEATANAVSFVAHAVALGAFDDWPRI